MTCLPRPIRRPAFTLLELLILLPLLAFLFGLQMWGFRAQIALHRRMAEQANRQVIMRSILNQLRTDMREASQIEFEALEGRPFDIGPKSVWVLRIDRRSGTVRYRLYDHSRPPDNTGGGREWSFPQVLVREDGEGEMREWCLGGQTLACRPESWASPRALAVRFTSRLADEAGPESFHIFETTLLTGGSYDAAAR